MTEPKDNRMQYPDMVKIDVEGAEFLVLKGMKRIMAKDHLKIYCELHLHSGDGSIYSFGHTPLDVVGLLLDYGFTIRGLPLRQDSHYRETAIDLEVVSNLKESVMLFAEK
ncbi:MAG: FkbM family methyltransferase [Chloroflexota bacterium]